MTEEIIKEYFSSRSERFDQGNEGYEINSTIEPIKPKRKIKIFKIFDPAEREIHREAFEYYFSLGENRTLAQVAEHLKIKKSVIEQWSSKFRWKERIKKLKLESEEERFKNLALEILLLFLNSLVKFDDDDEKLILTSADKTAFEKLKLCIEAFKKLRDDGREEEEMEAGNLRSTQKQGVTVNVIIKK